MTRPRIVDPHAVPVAGDDGHLPPVPAVRLNPDALRERFGREGNFAPSIPGDLGQAPVGTSASAASTVAVGATGAAPPGTFGPSPEHADAAVLVGLVRRPSGLQVLLTRRSDHLRDHAGQISFPGGRSEAEDGSAEATALREAQEEVGLSPRHVELLGRLPEYVTVTRYRVTPVVALVEPAFELALDAFEVAEAFEVPLEWLMVPRHHRRHVFSWDGGQRQFLSMPWRDDETGREYFIWGATAAMLRNLYHFLQA